ncbi:unnamed protein product [Schistosoma rodhaini]|nr:unnamed protein product [Schistosoma rodhaini]
MFLKTINFVLNRLTNPDSKNAFDSENINVNSQSREYAQPFISNTLDSSNNHAATPKGCNIVINPINVGTDGIDAVGQIENKTTLPKQPEPNELANYEYHDHVNQSNQINKLITATTMTNNNSCNGNKDSGAFETHRRQLSSTSSISLGYATGPGTITTPSSASSSSAGYGYGYGYAGSGSLASYASTSSSGSSVGNGPINGNYMGTIHRLSSQNLRNPLLTGESISSNWSGLNSQVSRETVDHSNVAVSTNNSNSSSVLTTLVPVNNNNNQNNDEELAKQSESSGLAAMLQEAIAARKRNKENRCNDSIRPSINSTSSNNPIISTTKSPPPPPPPPPTPPTLSSNNQLDNNKNNPIKRTDSTQQLRKDSIDQKSSMLAEIQRRIQARRQLIDAAEECGSPKKDHHLEPSKSISVSSENTGGISTNSIDSSLNSRNVSAPNCSTTSNIINSDLSLTRSELDNLRREIIVELRKEVQLAKNEIMDCIKLYKAV